MFQPFEKYFENPNPDILSNASTTKTKETFSDCYDYHNYR